MQTFGEFLELDLIDKNSVAGGDQTLHFYNLSRVISCIDFKRSRADDKKVLQPAFLPGSVPNEHAIFKNPLRKKMGTCLNRAGHDTLSRLVVDAGLRGSTLRAGSAVARLHTRS